MKLEVATGGNPVQALADVVGALGIRRGGIYDLAIAHDDECLSQTSQRLTDCTCEILELTATELEPPR